MASHAVSQREKSRFWKIYFFIIIFKLQSKFLTKCNRVKNLGWFLLAAAGIWVLTKVKAGLSLNFIPRGLSFDGGNFIVKLGIVNTSAFPLSFHSFSGNIFINGQDVGQVTDFYPVNVAANSETILPLSFQPKILSIVNDIVNFVKSGNPQQITIRGTINVENISLPIDQTFTASI